MRPDPIPHQENGSGACHSVIKLVMYSRNDVSDIDRQSNTCKLAALAISIPTVFQRVKTLLISQIHSLRTEWGQATRGYMHLTECLGTRLIKFFASIRVKNHSYSSLVPRLHGNEATLTLTLWKLVDTSVDSDLGST